MREMIHILAKGFISKPAGRATRSDLQNLLPMKSALLLTGLLLLFAVEIFRVYFIMPFPGSQQANTISLAYWISNNVVWLRILAIALIIFPAVNIFKRGKRWAKVSLITVIVIFAAIYFMANFRMQADKMFYEPQQKNFSGTSTNSIDPAKLVIGVTLNGESRAYPIQLIGYHHQVRDSIGNTPVMITYCTVCRTGRAFSPEVNGKMEMFRLVGMDHFNAMFEDATTKSWWQQATGIAIAGPLKGTVLKELPSQQATLASWIGQHPNTTVMQPDKTFLQKYDQLKTYDKGNGKSDLTKRDSASWKFKSWVVGIANGQRSTAYDWNHLVQERVIHDSFGDTPILVTVEPDTATFHVFKRKVRDSVLSFTKSGTDKLIDNMKSTWTLSGRCIDGAFKGEQLQSLQAYQEFWHSWKTFHPTTQIFKGGD